MVLTVSPWIIFPSLVARSLAAIRDGHSHSPNLIGKSETVPIDHGRYLLETAGRAM